MLARSNSSSRLLRCSLIVLLASVGQIQAQQKLALAPDSPQWALEEQAKVAEYQGRQALLLDGGAATVKDFEMRDGVIDMDIATPAKRGFFGIQFRMDKDAANGEWVYLRQHKSGLPDAMQYTPILNTGANWQIYNGPGFTGAVDIPKDVCDLKSRARRLGSTSKTWTSPRWSWTTSRAASTRGKSHSMC